MNTQHVLLWSHKQNALHIESLETHLSANRQCYRDNKAGDYRLLFVGDFEQVNQAAGAIHATLANRSRVSV